MKNSLTIFIALLICSLTISNAYKSLSSVSKLSLTKIFNKDDTPKEKNQKAFRSNGDEPMDGISNETDHQNKDLSKIQNQEVPKEEEIKIDPKLLVSPEAYHKKEELETIKEPQEVEVNELSEDDEIISDTGIEEKFTEREVKPDTPVPSLGPLLKKSNPPSNTAKRLGVVPVEKAFQNTKNIVHSFGSYKPSKKMWYFHKKIKTLGCRGIGSQMNVELEGYRYTVMVPVDMKELQVSILYPKHIEAGYSAGYRMSYLDRLYFDNSLLNSVYKLPYTDVQNEYYGDTIELNGIIYNVPAGEHTLKITSMSESNQDHQYMFCLYGGYNNKEVPVVISLTGFPDSE